MKTISLKLKIMILLFLLNNIYSLYCQDYIIFSDQNEIEVKINGNIILKQFYGPPNYGETPEIDSIENHYVLKLNEPISFSNETEIIIIDEIQLILDFNKLTDEINPNIDYLVVGRAFFRQTGHHHTQIIIIVDLILLNKIF